MSFYLVKNSTGITEIIESTLDYYEFEKEYPNVSGRFGRKDYAEIWKDFSNEKINSVELKNKLR